MNSHLKNFRLAYSQGHKRVVSLLKQFSKRRPFRSIASASSTLLRKIDRYKEQLASFGLPPFLEVCKINDALQAGVFLKPGQQPLKTGAFIGLYTGDYELVLANETKDNHYAYDVAQDITLQEKDLPYVQSRGKKINADMEFSIQTNALSSGNFTRYINHSLYHYNVEAITKKLPDGTIEVFLFACKTIKPGEQLLSNYGGLYWAVLPIIPEEINPRTYMLSKDGTIKRTKPLQSLTEKMSASLRPFRVALQAETSELPSSVRSLLSKAAIPYVSQKMHKKIEDFEEEILERGIPCRFTINRKKLTLKKGQKTLKKGSFIGVDGGIWRATPHEGHSEIRINKTLNLYLDRNARPNFTKFIALRQGGNVKARLYKKRGPNGLYVVFTAKRDIRPGEALSFSF